MHLNDPSLAVWRMSIWYYANAFSRISQTFMDCDALQYVNFMCFDTMLNSQWCGADLFAWMLVTRNCTLSWEWLQTFLLYLIKHISYCQIKLIHFDREGSFQTSYDWQGLCEGLTQAHIFFATNTKCICNISAFPYQAHHSPWCPEGKHLLCSSYFCMHFPCLCFGIYCISGFRTCLPLCMCVFTPFVLTKNKELLSVECCYSISGSVVQSRRRSRHICWVQLAFVL